MFLFNRQAFLQFERNIQSRLGYDSVLIHELIRINIFRSRLNHDLNRVNAWDQRLRREQNRLIAPGSYLSRFFFERNLVQMLDWVAVDPGAR